MKWWVFLLLPFSLLGQETYVNCGDLTPQNYEVNFDADKVYYWDISGGTITYSNNNSITVQWPDSTGIYVISAYTTRFGCDGDTSYYLYQIHSLLMETITMKRFMCMGQTKKKSNRLLFIIGGAKRYMKLMVIHHGKVKTAK